MLALTCASGRLSLRPVGIRLAAPATGTWCRLRRTYATESQPATSHLITLRDLSGRQIGDLVRSALHFKYACQAQGQTHHPDLPLQGQTLAVVFSKRSTRTRVATETAMAYLGGQGLFLSPQDIQLGVNESLRDTSQVVSSMCSGIMARVGAHAEIEELARYSQVPVINALSDTYHPTQILADLMTMYEAFSSVSPAAQAGLPLPPPASHEDLMAALRGLQVAWVGDANNIVWEMMMAFPKLGVHLNVATPRGYDTPASVRADAEKFLVPDSDVTPRLTFTHDPAEAIRDSHVVVTDTWVSMGQEAEKAQRLQDFAGYQITQDMVRRGNPAENWRFMHCLPRKPEEVDDEVFYSDRSLVFQEAENRKWTILAVLNALLVNKTF
ncbi:ornithine carbamoyltransferase [Tieghemiomyces parasiticus]|uniref:ornithine carbamoyltransferase n=1 Tax=Tieghemiomyces parasiticus TaxID=78921 RepID=A0A9W8AC73_9FUNG|nr:ornithine carbamoyltransferase [Tieghemiomyces parasiticus]